MENEKKAKSYQRWWFLFCVVFICLVIGCMLYLNYNNTNKFNVDLNQKITIGKLTYYIQEDWNNKERLNENATYKYYYPTDDTLLMITIETGNNYGNNVSIEDFLDGFISGLDLNNGDLIGKNAKKINGHNCGIVRFYTYINNDKYEAISYIITNNNECYVFMFGQKNKLNDYFIDLVENIISKTNIEVETEEEKQARLEREKIEKAQKEAEEKAKKEQEEKNFKESCKTYTFEQIARNPEKFKGTNVKVTGEVIQAIYNSSSVDLRVNITKQGKYSTYYTDTIYVVYYPKEGEDKILEDDIVTIYGISQGDYSYISTIGSKVTLPLIYGKYIQIQ